MRVGVFGLVWVSRTNRIPWGTLALLYLSPCLVLRQGGSIDILVVALFAGLYALSAVYTGWAMTVFRKLT